MKTNKSLFYILFAIMLVFSFSLVTCNGVGAQDGGDGNEEVVNPDDWVVDPDDPGGGEVESDCGLEEEVSSSILFAPAIASANCNNSNCGPRPITVAGGCTVTIGIGLNGRPITQTHNVPLVGSRCTRLGPCLYSGVCTTGRVSVPCFVNFLNGARRFGTSVPINVCGCI